MIDVNIEASLNSFNRDGDSLWEMMEFRSNGNSISIPGIGVATKVSCQNDEGWADMMTLIFFIFSPDGKVTHYRKTGQLYNGYEVDWSDGTLSEAVPEIVTVIRWKDKE